MRLSSKIHKLRFTSHHTHNSQESKMKQKKLDRNKSRWTSSKKTTQQINKSHGKLRTKKRRHSNSSYSIHFPQYSRQMSRKFVRNARRTKEKEPGENEPIRINHDKSHKKIHRKKSSHRTDWWECHRTTNEAHFEWMTVNNWKYYVPLNSLLMGYSCDFSSWLSSSLHLAQKSFLFFAWLSCCCLPLLTIVFFASVFLCASVCEHWAICQGSRNTHGNSILTAYSICLPHIWSLLS